MKAATVPPGQWWRAPTPDARRLLYYRCMRLHYGMTAVDALEATRRMFRELGESFDLMCSIRRAVFP